MQHRLLAQSDGGQGGPSAKAAKAHTPSSGDVVDPNAAEAPTEK